MNLNISYDLDVDKAYIIRIKGHEQSETMAQRCAESCQSVEMPYVFWDAYDGTQNPIQNPGHVESCLDFIRLTNHYLTRTEVACALSHISLWVECIKLDKPIVILEHDVIVLKKYTHHILYNAICYLGSKEQVKSGWPVRSIPPHGSDGLNVHFICRAHAYAIDPAVARLLFAHVLKNGIHESLDIMIRPDIFTIYQNGVYAYDEPGETTIANRPQTGSEVYRSYIRNDHLEL